jgi:hypothetical protein
MNAFRKVTLSGQQHCAAQTIAAVTVTAAVTEAVTEEAGAVIPWDAAQILTTQPPQTQHKQTVKQEAVTGSKAIATRDTHEHSQANQRDGVHSAYPSKKKKTRRYALGQV